MVIDPETLRRVMAALGRKGGKSTSKRKADAARRNASKPRRRLCSSCKAEVTATDKQAGYCTQCQHPLTKKGK